MKRNTDKIQTKESFVDYTTHLGKNSEDYDKRISEELKKGHIRLIELSPVLPNTKDFDSVNEGWIGTIASILVTIDFFTEKEIFKRGDKLRNIYINSYIERHGIEPDLTAEDIPCFWLTESIDGIPDGSNLFWLKEKEFSIIRKYYEEKIQRLKEGEIIHFQNIGKFSIALSSVIAKKKEPDLFKQLEEIGKEGVDRLKGEEYLSLTKEGKSIVLTKRQTQIVNALSHYLSQFLDSDEVKEYIAKLNENFSQPPESPICKRIDVKKFCETYNLCKSGSKNAKSKDVDDLVNEIKTLSRVEQILSWGDSKANYYFISPLIQYVSQFVVQKKKERESKNVMLTIGYSPIFLYKFNTRYIPLPLSFFDIFGRKGNGLETELGRVLLDDLRAKYVFYRQTAINKVKGVHRKDFDTTEGYNSECERVQRESLTYKQKLTTLIDKVLTDYTSDRRYVSKFKKDLNKALETIKELDIITDWKINIDSDGDYSLSIVFNPSLMDSLKEKRISAKNED